MNICECFLIFCGVQRSLEVIFFYQDAKKGHVIAKWTINLLAASFFLFLAVAYYDIKKSKVDFSEIVFFAFASLYVLSLALRITAIKKLQAFKSYNIELRRNQKVIKEGPYKYVRHPIYLSMILEAFSIPSAAQSLLSLAVVVFFYMPILLIRLNIEEKALVRFMGSEYLEYMKSTPALFPSIKWGDL